MPQRQNNIEAGAAEQGSEELIACVPGRKINKRPERPTEAGGGEVASHVGSSIVSVSRSYLDSLTSSGRPPPLPRLKAAASCTPPQVAVPLGLGVGVTGMEGMRSHRPDLDLPLPPPRREIPPSPPLSLMPSWPLPSRPSPRPRRRWRRSASRSRRRTPSRSERPEAGGARATSTPALAPSAPPSSG